MRACVSVCECAGNERAGNGECRGGKADGRRGDGRWQMGDAVFGALCTHGVRRFEGRARLFREQCRVGTAVWAGLGGLRKAKRKGWIDG